MKRLKLFLILAIFALASCQKVIEFDIDSSQRQLVLNAVPSAGQPLSVNFAYSEFFLDTTFNHPVANADMVVTVNGTEYHPTGLSGCNYLFGYTLQEDDQLSIRLRADGQDITANTYVPRAPQIQNLYSVIDSSDVFNCLVANFDIVDHPNYTDYYCITITQRDSGCRYSTYFEKYDTIDTVYSTFFLCGKIAPSASGLGLADDPDLTGPDAAANIALGGYFFDKLLVKDTRIDGTTHNTTLLVMLLKDTTELMPFRHDYTLNIETVTPERFRYLQDLGNATSFVQLIAEPAPVYSNVNGALGIFAGNARATFPLQTIIGGKEIPTVPRHKQKKK